MKIKKRVLCAERLRQVPPQFSWIDQRFIRDRHYRGCSTDALALYLVLVTVGDAEGLSYYSETSLGKMLGLSSGELRQARRELEEAGLIVYQEPLYQVLSLDELEAAPKPTLAPRLNQSLSAAEILERIAQGGKR